MLCHVDVEDPGRPLHVVTKQCVLGRCTLVCGWSPLECARYLETIKAFEMKPADLILGHVDRDYLSRLHAALGAVKGISRTDSVSLGRSLGSLGRILTASPTELESVPGIGPIKAKRLYAAFHEPFVRPPRAILHSHGEGKGGGEGEGMGGGDNGDDDHDGRGGNGDGDDGKGGGPSAPGMTAAAAAAAPPLRIGQEKEKDSVHAQAGKKKEEEEQEMEKEGPRMEGGKQGVVDEEEENEAEGHVVWGVEEEWRPDLVWGTDPWDDEDEG